MKTAAQSAEKWARNLSGSTESIKQGVMGVTVSPTEKAAAQAGAYQAGVMRAVADGKFAAGLRRVSLDDWKQATLRKGLNRIAAGATEAKPKMQEFMDEFLPHVQAGQRLLESMPRGDINSNIQRAVTMMEHNSKFRRRS
jgi:hypothetical protein